MREEDRHRKVSKYVTWHVFWYVFVLVNICDPPVVSKDQRLRETPSLPTILTLHPLPTPSTPILPLIPPLQLVYNDLQHAPAQGHCALGPPTPAGVPSQITNLKATVGVSTQLYGFSPCGTCLRVFLPGNKTMDVMVNGAWVMRKQGVGGREGGREGQRDDGGFLRLFPTNFHSCLSFPASPCLSPLPQTNAKNASGAH